MSKLSKRLEHLEQRSGINNRNRKNENVRFMYDGVEVVVKMLPVVYKMFCKNAEKIYGQHNNQQTTTQEGQPSPN